MVEKGHGFPDGPTNNPKKEVSKMRQRLEDDPKYNFNKWKGLASWSSHLHETDLEVKYVKNLGVEVIDMKG